MVLPALFPATSLCALEIRDGHRTEQNSNLANSELGSGAECKVPDLCKTDGEL